MCRFLTYSSVSYNALCIIFLLKFIILRLLGILMLIIIYEYINIIQNMTKIENPQLYYAFMKFSHKFHYAVCKYPTNNS